jgi:3-oxoacyl-[acyl-carrier protein] reductase
MLLDGRVAVVTGSGRGIGREIALCLAREGARLVINDVGVSLDGRGTDADPASQVCKEIQSFGGEAVPSYDSVSDFDGAGRIIQTAVDSFGQIDILVNNAGITRDTLLARMSEDDWRAVLSTNLDGAFHTCKAVSRKMLKRRAGAIVNMTSFVGLHGNPGQANYAASKAGIIGFTKALAKELGPRGVRVNAVAPGYFRSEMTTAVFDDPATARWLRRTSPMGRGGEPHELDGALLFLASDASSYVTGAVVPVDGGWTAA